MLFILLVISTLFYSSVILKANMVNSVKSWACCTLETAFANLLWSSFILVVSSYVLSRFLIVASSLVELSRRISYSVSLLISSRAFSFNSLFCASSFLRAFCELRSRYFKLSSISCFFFFLSAFSLSSSICISRLYNKLVKFFTTYLCLPVCNITL